MDLKKWNDMKGIYNFLLFFTFLISLNLNANAFSVNWYYTGVIQHSDTVFIKEYCAQIKNKNGEVKFFLIDLNTNSRVQYDVKKPFPTLKSFDNKKFKSNEDLIHYCDSVFNKKNCFIYSKINENIPTYPNVLPEGKDKLKRTLKVLRNDKFDELKILYFNGFKPYKFSKERYLARIKKSIILNDFSDLKIDLLNPKQGKTYVLRPDEKYYTLDFDSIGIFDQYEIEIYCETPSALGTWLKIRVGFSDFEDQSDIVLYYTGELRECKLKISETLLGDKCFELSNDINTDEIPEKDDDCGICKLECLYQKKFSVSITGVSSGYSDPKVKNVFKPLLFQCTKQ